jgi:hypothetical protein
MRLGDSVTVDCTDTGKSMDGTVHRIGVDYLEVLVGLDKQKIRIILRKRPNTRLYVGNAAGMEFTVTTA